MPLEDSACHGADVVAIRYPFTVGAMLICWWVEQGWATFAEKQFPRFFLFSGLNVWSKWLSRRPIGWEHADMKSKDRAWGQPNSQMQQMVSTFIPTPQLFLIEWQQNAEVTAKNAQVYNI